jgi:hypothetical protein
LKKVAWKNGCKLFQKPMRVLVDVGDHAADAHVGYLFALAGFPPAIGHHFVPFKALFSR